MIKYHPHMYTHNHELRTGHLMAGGGWGEGHKVIRFAYHVAYTLSLSTVRLSSGVYSHYYFPSV